MKRNPVFVGQKCERNVDECDSLPCQNGGICVDGSNSYTCTCKNGFQGECQSTLETAISVSSCSVYFQVVSVHTKIYILTFSIISQY